MHLLSLPEEVILLILSQLNAREILAFATVSRYMKNFYDSSSRLQYTVELEATGCIDPSYGVSHIPKKTADELGESSATVSEKLKYLRTREARWRELDLQKNATGLPLDHPVDVSIYDLSSGVFALGEADRENMLHYIDLREVSKRGGRSMGGEITNAPAAPIIAPNTSDDANEGMTSLHGTIVTADPPGQNLFEPIMLPPTDVPWQTFPFEGTVADIGFALKEHDLVVIVSYKRVNHGEGILHLPSEEELELNLFEFSTRRPHPLAAESVIHLSEMPPIFGRPSPVIEIAGKYVVVILKFPRAMLTPIEEYFIINWQTGETIHRERFHSSKYCCVAFVTPSLIVLPNMTDNMLDLVHVFTDPDGKERACWPRRLCLPELTDEFKLRSSYCRGDPNPTAKSPDILNPNSNAPITRPGGTQPQPVGSNTRERRQWGSSGYGITADPLRAIISIKFVILHEQEDLPRGPALNLILHRSTLAKLASEGIEELRQAVFRGEIEVSAMEYSAPETSWKDWGPPATRWRLEDDYIEWVTTTAGQRQVLVSLSSESPWRPIILVRDYNQNEVRRVKMKAKLSKENGVDEDENIHVDSLHGERDSDSEDEDEFGLGENDWGNRINGSVGFLQNPELGQIDEVENPLEEDEEDDDSEDDLDPQEFLDRATQTIGSIAAALSGDNDLATSQLNEEAEVQQLLVDDSSVDSDDSEAQHDYGGPSSSVNPPPPESASSVSAIEPSESSASSSTSIAAPSPPSRSPQQTSALLYKGNPARVPTLKLSAIRVRDTIAAPSVRYYKKGELCGGLPCVEYTVEGNEYLYTGLLMDEERIIGYFEDANNPGQVERLKHMSVFSMYP